MLWCGAGWLAVWRFACPLPCAVGTAGGLGCFFRRLAPLPVSSFSFPFVVAVAVVPRLACRLAHWADGLARGSVASVGSLLGWLVAGHRAHAAGWLGGPQGFGPCGRSLGVPRWVAGSLLLLPSGRRDVGSQPDMCCRSFVVFLSFALLLAEWQGAPICLRTVVSLCSIVSWPWVGACHHPLRS